MSKRMKYFSFDKMSYLFEATEEEMLSFQDSMLLDPDLKIAG